MKEKRYRIIKRNELEGRNPEKINALGAPDSSLNGEILNNRSRYEICAPRSSLNNNMYNLMAQRGEEELSAFRDHLTPKEPVCRSKNAQKKKEK